MSNVLYVTNSDLQQRGLRPPLLHRITTRQLLYIDYLVAVTLIALTEVHVQHAQHGTSPVNAPLVVVLGISAAAAIALRRRYPMFALGLFAFSMCVVTVNGQAFIGGPLIAFPVYQVATNYGRRRSIVAIAVVCSATITSALFHFHFEENIAVAAVVAAVAAWFVGDSVQIRRTYDAGLVEQAAQRQREILERAQRTVAEERLQMARELHDVVAHSLSVIAVQSGVGRHVIDEHPGQAKVALGAVEETSRTALVELRRMLGILRQDDQSPATLAPAPGVNTLGQLIDQVRSTGVNVSLEIQSSLARDPSPTANLAIYRIVQEALTNVVKHAGAASVTVELRDELDALVLEINDDGGGNLPKYPTVEDASARHGIIGMRERVALFDGTFEAGARPTGGYRVLARFPSTQLGAA